MMKMGFLDFLLPKKPTQHELKWKLPEQRISFEIPDSEKMVYALKKNKCIFAKGGEFTDVIHVKQFGEAVFAYFIVRTEKRTQKETLFFEGYMLQEEDKLGFEVQSSYSMMEQLESLGYSEAFPRELQEWNFNFGVLRIKVVDITGFGNFIEFALPETKFQRAREAQEKTLELLLKKLELDRKKSVPTDVTTIQLMEAMQAGGKK